MIKVKREDFLELDENDDNFNLDNVNNLFQMISEDYNNEEENEDGRKEN